jgi:hypothetical protein
VQVICQRGNLTRHSPGTVQPHAGTERNHCLSRLSAQCAGPQVIWQGRRSLKPSTGSRRQSPRIDRATRVPLHRLKVIWIQPHGKQVPPHTPAPQPCRKLPKPTPLVLCCSIQTRPTGKGRVSTSLNGPAQPQARNGSILRSPLRCENARRRLCPAARKNPQARQNVRHRRIPCQAAHHLATPYHLAGQASSRLSRSKRTIVQVTSSRRLVHRAQVLERVVSR